MVVSINRGTPSHRRWNFHEIDHPSIGVPPLTPIFLDACDGDSSCHLRSWTGPAWEEQKKTRNNAIARYHAISNDIPITNVKCQ